MVNFRSRPSDVGSDWIRRTNAEWRRRNQQRAVGQRASKRQHVMLFISGMVGAAAVVVALADWARW